MKKIRVGLDFDGVVAYNPARIVRAPITYVKRKLFGVRKLKFYVPKTALERWIWALAHESSIFPAIGAGRLRDMAAGGKYEFYLVSARFGYLQPNLFRWLRLFKLKDVFAGIYINQQDRQPHIHKEETIRTLKLDYFVEDNWDIVEYLQGKTSARVMWIYNITDRGIAYEDKYPFLDRALSAIQSK